MVTKDLAYTVYLPLLDVIGMGVGEPEQALGKMAHHGAFVQEFLVVELLGQHFFLGGAAQQRALVGKDQLLRRSSSLARARMPVSRILFRFQSSTPALM